MFKPIIGITLISALFISSCGGEKKEDSKDKEEKKEEGSSEETAHIKTANDSEITPNMLADISITGMVCEVNCVGSVKKLLSAMVGVAEIEIDFNSANSINHAMVKFDNSKVNDRQMVSAIEKLNDGVYKVEDIDIKKLEERTVSSKKKSDEKEISIISSSASGSGAGFALPNILDVFNIL